MNKTFDLSREAIESLFDRYFHIVEQAPEEQGSRADVKVEQNFALLSHFYPCKSELSGQERKFTGDVLTAIGLQARDTLSYFIQDIGGEQAIEEILINRPTPFAFVWGPPQSWRYKELYSIQILADTQLFILPDTGRVLGVLEEKRKLWNLIKGIPFSQERASNR